MSELFSGGVTGMSRAIRGESRRPIAIGIGNDSSVTAVAMTCSQVALQGQFQEYPGCCKVWYSTQAK